MLTPLSPHAAAHATCGNAAASDGNAPVAHAAIRREIAEATVRRLSTLGLPQRRLAAHRFAAMLGLTQARLNALLTGRLAQFGADALIALATKRGSTCG